ncbi:MAG TPA: hypothetical protein VGB43_07620, partial [Flavobacterium sp.]
MKKIKYKGVVKVIALILILLGSKMATAQDTIAKPKERSDFWKRVQFGGGLGGSFGSGYSNFTIAPGALYNVNKSFGVGVGLKYTYIAD